MTDPHALAQQAAHDAAVRDQRVQGRIDAMPAQLRSFPHWGFYLGDKAPRSASGVRFSINDPTSWATYDQLRTAPRGDAIGPTFVVNGTGLTVIDLDNPERAFGSLDGEDRQRAIDAANVQINRLLKWAIECGAWIERSSSGKGLHILVFGQTPEAKYAIRQYGHIYRDGHVHMTGDLHPRSSASIPNAQSALNELIAYALSIDLIRPVAKTEGTTAHVCEEHGRRLDLSDAQVIDALNASSRRMLDGETPSNWSGDTFRLVLDLDKVTGDPEQVHRILFASKRLKFAGRAANGADRYARTEDQFGVMLAKARAKNDAYLSKFECVNGVWQARTGALDFNPQPKEPNQ
ncbi:hypothetical protein [Mesorhizobium sp. B4-1-4]|uniref:hypothetical protein n=1 Tax=Mesorhizobium sp. B4-1-4 TaxID=2589888 RepID=UPI00112801FF|nr:hypothetical protein [Mesorhizobium sp. B4-1-4]UCI32530.1 hypothetical protein FJW03_03485 [Mesorhizobium sp. B4-1-4]